ncbi:hypothetical protein CWC11_17510 [Pseudoalteromonas sp. S3178]|nr:hypothetical protein CWC11_17510 [Pseudoalteromonas sp. S3178]
MEVVLIARASFTPTVTALGNRQRATGFERLGVKIAFRRLACWCGVIKIEAVLIARASFTPTLTAIGQ